MATRIAIVDSGSGNLRSVQKALQKVGADAFISGHADEVAKADKIVVPGQGAFGGCMGGLNRNGGALRALVLDAIKKGTPFLGICIGLQVLFEGSDEDPSCPGLGVFAGRVKKFEIPLPLKVPHMGWNACRQGAAGGASILGDTPDGTYFYFVHSYFPVPANPADIALESEHGTKFCAAVARDNLFACQFHPEKSQRAGLTLLSRFVNA
jgi:glutamine amidotransferase